MSSLHSKANHPSALHIDSPISVCSDYIIVNQEMKPMHTIIKITVVSVLALFAIVGVVGISKAEENIDTEAVREKIMRGVL